MVCSPGTHNTQYKGIALKWSDPPDVCKPNRRWRLYVFKGEEVADVYHVHREPSYLFGRERKVADIPTDHPSCSGQHAVLCYRVIERADLGGEVTQHIRWRCSSFRCSRCFFSLAPAPRALGLALYLSLSCSFGFLP